MIQKGSVAIRKRRGSGFVDLGKVFPGEVIGEVSFFDRNPRSASAVAVGEVEAIEIPFDGLEKVYSTLPDYMQKIVASLADRLRKANDTIRKLQDESHDAPEDPPGDGEALDAAGALAALADFEVPSGKRGE